MTEFQEKLRQQHEDSMHRELQALLATANKAEAEVSAVRTPPPNDLQPILILAAAIFDFATSLWFV